MNLYRQIVSLDLKQGLDPPSAHLISLHELLIKTSHLFRLSNLTTIGIMTAAR